MTEHYFPASAYRGPFLPLLRYHARAGLGLTIDILNHSADWYANPRVASSDSVVPPLAMSLTFADGTTQAQWCNERLWNLYRGTSVGPYVLQSILMALERWLMEFARARPEQLDQVLLLILKQSQNAALTGVVASIATAFPHAARGALLVLLHTPECILLDKRRLFRESDAPSRTFGLMPRLDRTNQIYEDERTDADAWPHRRSDLETAILNLQLGPSAAEVQELLDQHHAEMPPPAEQDEGDRVWRLALHRMDFRQYTPSDEVVEAPAGDDEGPGQTGSHRYVRMDLNPPEPDVKEMADRSAAEMSVINSRLRVLMWGIKIFTRESGTQYDPADWRRVLVDARAIEATGADDPELMGRDGRGYVAAVCVREHWDGLSPEEQRWCVDMVCSEIERDDGQWNHLARVQRMSMSADRPCAWVVSALVAKGLEGDQQARVNKALVIALTHSIDEVRGYAANGVGTNLWPNNPTLARRCVYAVATEGRLVQERVDAEHERLIAAQHFSILGSGGWVDPIEAQVASEVREQFAQADGIRSDALRGLDLSLWFGAKANVRLLTILNAAPDEPEAVDQFERTVRTLVQWWDDDDDRRDRQNRRRERNHETDIAIAHLIQDFVLRTSPEHARRVLQPILDAVDRHPRNIHMLLLGLIEAEDRLYRPTQFWSVWRLFAERLRQAKWLRDLDREYSLGGELVTMLFLGASWKEGTRHWRSLEGHADNVDSLFDALPATSSVLEAYVRFLFHVGEQSLPAAFVRITSRLQQGDARQMLRRANTVFMLELLLKRYVHSRPLELKRERRLRDAVLSLLDVLVENGSSAAFRVRDDFVTPLGT